VERIARPGDQQADRRAKALVARQPARYHRVVASALHALDVLPELARKVFLEEFGEPTRAQALAWPVIASGGNALVVAPTGSGKTLAAFYAFLARLVETPPGEAGVELVYVSPLKALATDIERNLRAPLAHLTAALAASGRPPADVKVLVRTGDTSTRERAAMQRRPPRVLVTTPESLYLVLTSPRSREMLRPVRAVIVDEVHALVPTKRGVHLALSLERLEDLAGRPVQRIGLSATVRPHEEAARWLAGHNEQGQPRPVAILDAAERKPLDLEIQGAADPDVVGPRGVWPPIAAELVRIIEAHRSTLVFCNNRRLAERITSMVNEAAGRPLACSHHGSVSRERRQEVEGQLKSGRLRSVVATGSLELGIDVGTVDCVVQLQSPKAVARALQRIGRSGHVVGGTAKGRILPTHRGDYLEAAAVARGILDRDVEETRAPLGCLDILAQQIVAEVAAERSVVPARRLYASFRRAHSYQALAWTDYMAVVEMLAGRYQSNALRDMRPRVDWNPRDGGLAPLPGTRALATGRPGAIPDRGLFRVEREGTRERLGELDEEFVFESRVGEVFVLGATSWRIARILKDRVIVRGAGPGEPAKMPFWRGEGLGRSYAVGRQLGALVRELAAPSSMADRAATADELRRTCALDATAARIVIEHVARQREAGAVPDDATIVVELYADDLGDTRVALLSPFGGRVHAAWAILLTAEARHRLGLEIPHVATDDGILFRPPSEEVAARMIGLTRWVPAADAPERLAAEIEATPLYAGLFRDAAQRALILPGRGPSGRAPLWLARLRAADLAELMRAHPDFPIAREARREALEDALDVRGLVGVLGQLERGELRAVPVKRANPSPFAAQLELAFTMAFLYEGDTPRIERRARALAAGPDVAALLPPDEVAELLEPEAIGKLEARLQHLAPGTRARTPEELADLLRRLADLSDDEAGERYDGDARQALQALYVAGRIARFPLHGGSPWVLQEDLELWREIGEDSDRGRAARAEIVRRFAAAHGPFGAERLSARYGFATEEIESVLDALAGAGMLVRQRPGPGGSAAIWCDRRNLAEAHRRTLALLRDRGAPATMAQLAAFLVDRHRAADVGGAVSLLSGVAVPQETFERDLLWRRLESYHPPFLDAACAAGEVAWLLEGAKLTIAPHAELALWVTAQALPDDLSSTERAVLEALAARGAQFGPEIVTTTALRAADVYVAVWSLVQRGLVTNDAYEALRRAGAQGFDPVEAGLELGDRPVSVRKLVSRVRRSPWVGRFSRAPSEPLALEERAARQAAVLLRRYGIVGKPMADAESRTAPWPELEEALRRLELRGEVVRGHFVEGLGAYQVALTDAVDDLRARRGAETLVLVSACDPICPYGGIAPDIEGRVARVPSNYLVLRGGAPLLLVEGFGRRITPLAEASDDVLAEGLATLRGLLAVPAHLRGVRAVTVHRFADREAAEAQALFARAGFTRDADRMVLSVI
jgi:ATP-dependent Lhr-like helicase